MNLRLWQRLFLTFAALSSVALTGFLFWQQQAFRKGFLGYIEDVTLERLQPATRRLAEAHEENGGWQFLQGDKALFAELLEPDLRRLRRGPGERRRLPLPDRPPPEDFDEPPPPGDHRDRPPPRVPPRVHALRARQAEANLLARLLLVDARGRPVVGDPEVRQDAIRLPIEVDGRAVGTLYLGRLPQLRGATDLAFAREQLRNALVAGIAILALALLLAFALARWLLEPVRELAAGTRALAAGDYGRRVGDRRRDELGALAQDFNHLAVTLEQHRDARRRWGADIAHELRTPLSVLRGEIQALQDGVREVTPEALNSLHTECERMGNLIEDLYQLSLADAGTLEYTFAPVDLADILRGSLSALNTSFEDAGLVLEADIREVPLLRGDIRRLEQLVDNLLGNCRRYTDAPGRVRVELREHDNRIRLRIEDSAPGVPDAALPRVFDRLYRVDPSRNRGAGGAGLGLAICKAIVHAHGGHIDAEHSGMGGLRVNVHFPVATRL
ncbi:ATP-binding protein [Dokdonella sp.]|uniref:ATP-binding protein n=1 Tax=Dokdonella sp. TaxID=2291710 RepID=UPI0035278368